MPTAKKKNKSFLSKINFKSPKTRGLLIILLFAVIGGGVMVFRSFAATNVIESWSYNASNNLLAPSAVGGCSAQKVTETSKSGAAVYNLACSNNNVSGMTFAAVSTIGAAGAKDNYYRACAMIKGGGKALVILEGSKSSSSGFDAYPVGNGYTYYCDGTVKLSATQALTAKVQIDKGSLVNVSFITIEHMAAPDVTPIVGPTVCEKNCTGGK